ncbi:hypothetical protein RZO55_24275 [Clostridium boliviensis]|uniref:Uncharacterized protein n=1 Tax=Clostridium boliviensis TaxID=318465 RepID=A0ABU4GSS1_9CLOT|nr:hypothetical protein [Clostridium boliviensis]MDW2800691.1 hypothetical protein [Clostridium boliviensis]
MQFLIDGQAYNYVNNALKNEDTRKNYFQLAKQIYGLKFDKWYQSGYWDDHFIPYLIEHDDIAVSSVAVCINDICWNGKQKRYVHRKRILTYLY